MLKVTHAIIPSPYLRNSHQFISACLLHVRVWTARVCSVTNAAHIHAHISQDGYTALYLAAQGGHEDVVELLLEAKADLELTKVINKFIQPHVYCE